MVDVVRADLLAEGFIFFLSFAPDIHNKLSSLCFKLSWVFWILELGVDVDHDCFAESTLGYGTIDDELMDAWSKVGRVDKHVFTFFREVFEILGGSVFHVDVGELICVTLVEQDILPVAYFSQNGCLFKNTNFIFV